jgi:pyruvate dehydrogenase E1 component
MPEGSAEGIIKGMYLLKDAGKAEEGRAARAAAGQRHHPARGHRRGRPAGCKDFGIKPTSGPAPASTNCARDGFDAERWNRFHPEAKTPRKAWVTQLLEGRQGPAIAATDYVRAFADQIREFVPMRYSVLGTDGYGRSDTRANLRRHFEVDRFHIAHAAVAALAADGKLTGKDVARAIKLYKLDAEKPNPLGFELTIHLNRCDLDLSYCGHLYRRHSKSGSISVLTQFKRSGRPAECPPRK